VNSSDQVVAGVGIAHPIQGGTRSPRRGQGGERSQPETDRKSGEARRLGELHRASPFRGANLDPLSIAKEGVDGRWPLERADRRPDPLPHGEARA